MNIPPILEVNRSYSRSDISSWLSRWAGQQEERLALSAVIKAIAEAAIPLGERLALGSIFGNPAAVVGTNDSGDSQKLLDVAAHEHFILALKSVSVHRVVSEEAEDVISLSEQGMFNVAMDPIDGSGSIGIGAPLGMFFSIFPRGGDLSREGGFLRRGREILAAGYISFGHSMDFVFSMGEGVVVATFDRSAGLFKIVQTDLQIPPKGSVLAYNASNVGRWSEQLQSYIKDCLSGKEGPRERRFNMRWLGAAVGDLHRILHQGGIFLYPADRRKGYEQGRLRLLYEAFPMAFLIEQAGGKATDGHRSILDRKALSLHENTPLFFGGSEEVTVLLDYLIDPS